MEIKAEKQAMEAQKELGRTVVQTLVTAHTGVPGAGRDPIEVLMEEASFELVNQEGQEGRAVIDGVVRCQAVYRQGDAPAQAVAAQAQVSQTAPLEGLTPGSILQVKGVVESVSAQYENGRMRFTCALTLEVQAAQLEEARLITRLDGLPQAQVRFEEIASVKLAAQASAQATLTQEVALPQALDARVSLMDWACSRVTGMAPTLEGVQVTGEAVAEALIGTGVAERPMALVKVAMPWDILVKLPQWLTQDVAPATSVKGLTVSVLPPQEGEDGALLRLEAQVEAQVQAFSRDSVTALTDAYVPGDQALTCALRPLTLTGAWQKIDHQQALRETLLLPQDAPGVGVVLGVRARPVISQWAMQGENTRLEGALDVKALYMPLGGSQVTSVRGEVPFSITCPGQWEEDAWVEASLWGVEASALMSDRLEIRANLALWGGMCKKTALPVVESLEALPASPLPSGLIIHWPQAGDTPWSLGKAYRLPQEQVEKAWQESPKGSPVILRV